MASTPSEYFLDRILSCPACTEPYQEPKQLPCQHSVCKRCLVTHFQNGVVTQDGSSGILCPVCGEYIKTPSAATSPDQWVHDLPTNRALEDLLVISTMKEDLGSKVVTCEIHTGRICEYFCSDHGVVVCSSCAIEGHRRCAQVISCIDALAEKKSEVTTLTELMTEQVETVLQLQEDRKTCLETFETSRETAKQTIKALKKDLDEKLRMCEARLLLELDEVSDTETRQFQEEIQTLQSIADTALKMKTSVVSDETDENKWRVLFFLEKMQRTVSANARLLAEFQSNLTDVNLEFHPEASLQSRLVNFGLISCNRIPVAQNSDTLDTTGMTSMDQSSLSTSTDEVEKVEGNATLIKQLSSKLSSFLQSKQVTVPRIARKKVFNARTVSDEADCWITGAVFLPGGHILLADNSNQKLKLFNKKYQLVEELILDSKPWDVACSADVALVTLPEVLAIHTYKVGSSIRFVSSRKLSAPWYGVEQKQDITVTGTLSTGNACVMLQNSRDRGPPIVIRPTDKSGKSVLHKLLYITMSHDAENIYVTDKFWNHSVKCLKPSGELEWERKLMGTYRVNGIAVLSDIIYVGAKTSVEMLDRTGQLLGPILTEERGIEWVQTVCTDNDRRLLVTEGHPKGSTRDNVVKLFYLETASKKPYLFTL